MKSKLLSRTFNFVINIQLSLSYVMGLWSGCWVMMPSLCRVMTVRVWFISVSNEIVNCYMLCCVLCQTSKTSPTSVNKEGGTGNTLNLQQLWGNGQTDWLELSSLFLALWISGYLVLWSFLGNLCQHQPAMLEYFIIFSKWMQGRDV